MLLCVCFNCPLKGRLVGPRKTRPLSSTASAALLGWGVQLTSVAVTEGDSSGLRERNEVEFTVTVRGSGFTKCNRAGEAIALLGSGRSQNGRKGCLWGISRCAGLLYLGKEGGSF